MSQLIQLRQRIKAIEVTKKTTNAMRLIAMSSHTRLRQAQEALSRYTHVLDTMLAQIAQKEVISFDPQETPTTNLIIIIGSQKGLCGNFNINLAYYAIKRLEQEKSSYELMIIGKQMREKLLSYKIEPMYAYDEFSFSNFLSIAHEIAQKILSPRYAQVTIYFTAAKSFFLHKPQEITLHQRMFLVDHDHNIAQGRFILEQTYQATYNQLGALVLQARVEEALIDSLLAEQAARFLSMDSATRNADDLLDTMKLNYNKLRQSVITRELTDLSGSFM